MTETGEAPPLLDAGSSRKGGSAGKRPPESSEKPRLKPPWRWDPRMADAVKEWDEGTHKPMSMNAFAKAKQIPRSTFMEYACSDKSKRRPLGMQPGGNPLLDDDQSESLCQMATLLEVKIGQLNPDMSPEHTAEFLPTTNPKSLPTDHPGAAAAHPPSSVNRLRDDGPQYQGERQPQQQQNATGQQGEEFTEDCPKATDRNSAAAKQHDGDSAAKTDAFIRGRCHPLPNKTEESARINVFLRGRCQLNGRSKSTFNAVALRAAADGSPLEPPESAGEVKFDIADPPSSPVCPPSASPLLESATSMTVNDVLCGRGGETYSQNWHFRALVRDFQPMYLAAKCRDNSRMARSVVLIVRNRGGRFLRRDDSDGRLYEVGDEKAEAKTDSALREGLYVHATKMAMKTLIGTASESGGGGEPLKSGNKLKFDITDPPSTPVSASEVKFDITDPPSSPVCPPSASPVMESATMMTENDVLCGRGGETNSQVGNRRFRALVRDFQPTYLMAKRGDKARMARSVVLIVRNRGGRFLQRDGSDGRLYEVGDVKAEAKTGQALRERLDVRATKMAAIVGTTSESGAGGNSDKKRKQRSSLTSEKSLDKTYRGENNTSGDENKACANMELPARQRPGYPPTPSAQPPLCGGSPAGGQCPTGYYPPYLPRYNDPYHHARYPPNAPFSYNYGGYYPPRYDDPYHRARYPPNALFGQNYGGYYQPRYNNLYHCASYPPNAPASYIYRGPRGSHPGSHPSFHPQEKNNIKAKGKPKNGRMQRAEGEDEEFMEEYVETTDKNFAAAKQQPGDIAAKIDSFKRGLCQRPRQRECRSKLKFLGAVALRAAADGSPSVPKSASEVKFDIADPPSSPVFPPSSSPVLESATLMTDNDVLCGRGGETNSQMGNRRFRALVRDFQPTYLMAKRRDKPRMARSVVLIVRNRGGRFLRRDGSDGKLYEVGDEKAEAKTAQALRERLYVHATKTAANTLAKKKKQGPKKTNRGDDKASGDGNKAGAKRELPATPAMIAASQK